jgi:hypothetical protein
MRAGPYVPPYAFSAVTIAKSGSGASSSAASRSRTVASPLTSMPADARKSADIGASAMAGSAVRVALIVASAAVDCGAAVWVRTPS